MKESNLPSDQTFPEIVLPDEARSDCNGVGHFCMECGMTYNYSELVFPTNFMEHFNYEKIKQIAMKGKISREIKFGRSYVVADIRIKMGNGQALPPIPHEEFITYFTEEGKKARRNKQSVLVDGIAGQFKTFEGKTKALEDLIEKDSTLEETKKEALVKLTELWLHQDSYNPEVGGLYLRQGKTDIGLEILAEGIISLYYHSDETIVDSERYKERIDIIEKYGTKEDIAKFKDLTVGIILEKAETTFQGRMNYVSGYFPRRGRDNFSEGCVLLLDAAQVCKNSRNMNLAEIVSKKVQKVTDIGSEDSYLRKASILLSEAFDETKRHSDKGDLLAIAYKLTSPYKSKERIDLADKAMQAYLAAGWNNYAADMAMKLIGEYKDNSDTKIYMHEERTAAVIEALGKSEKFKDLAQFHFNAGEYLKSEDHYHKAVEASIEAEENNQAIRITEHYLKDPLRAAKLCEDQGMIDEARARYEKMGMLEDSLRLAETIVT